MQIVWVIRLCSSRKYPLTEIARRRGVLKAQIFKGKCGTNMELQKGSMRGVWIFSGTTHYANVPLVDQP